MTPHDIKEFEEKYKNLFSGGDFNQWESVEEYGLLSHISSLIARKKEEWREEIDKEIKSICVDYPDDDEGRQMLHENKLYIEGLKYAKKFIQSKE